MATLSISEMVSFQLTLASVNGNECLSFTEEKLLFLKPLLQRLETIILHCSPTFLMDKLSCVHGNQLKI